jgi:hypothetical protein
MVEQHLGHWRPMGLFPQRYPASDGVSKLFVYR